MRTTKKCKINFFLGCILVFGITLVSYGLSNSAPAGEKVHIELLTGRPGDPWTVMTYALSSFINADSQMIRTSVIPTGGLGDTVKILIEQPERRKKAIATLYQSGAYPTRAQMGFWPSFVGLINTYAFTWITYDPKIKRLEDFKGKVVAGPREGPGWWDQFLMPLKVAGVFDTLKITKGGAGGALQSLIDGKADIAWTVVDATYPNLVKPSSLMEQASVRGQLYFPDWGKDRIEVETAKMIGFPLKAVEVPPKSLGKTQENTIYVLGDPHYWGAGKEMDEEIVNEILRILWERAGKKDFAGFHWQGQGIVHGSVPYCVWKNKKEIEDWYHPGALKFYRKAGVPGL